MVIFEDLGLRGSSFFILISHLIVFQYSANRERLEATALVPEDPLSNPDEANVDIKNLCVLSMEVLARVPQNHRAADPQDDQVSPLNVFGFLKFELVVLQL